MQDPASSRHPVTTKLINPCTACKLRHRKCDADRPACANCRKSDSECIRGYRVRFRHGLNPSVRAGKALDADKRDYTFSRDQPWVQTNRSLNFVDETRDVIDIHDPNSDSWDNIVEYESIHAPDDTGSRHSSPLIPSQSFDHSYSQSRPASEPGRAGSTTQTNNGQIEDGNPRKRRALSHNSLSTPASLRAISLPTLDRSQNASGSSQTQGEVRWSNDLDSSVLGQEILSGIQIGNKSPDMDVSQTREELPSRKEEAESFSEIYLSTPNWPLTRQEAMLFQYYIKSMAYMFDLCDEERQFATVVPRRAVSCPPLMNAILAASAKRLSRSGAFDAVTGDKYHQRCLDVLIPALSSSTAVMDENLLAAIIILRYMEEVDIPLASDTARESHLMGTRIFVAAQEKLSNFTGLRLAAFWVGLRQEIYMAFIQARPVHPTFSLENVSLFLKPDDSGCCFANMTIVHCAACLRYCYGVEEQSVSTWERLNEAQDRLWEARPWSFQPMYTDNGQEGFFPEEIYLNDAVVTGVQHYYLTRVLMAAHNPKAPKLGPGQAKASRATNEEIKRMVRLICGIAESTSGIAPAYVNACIAITMAGDRFTDPFEQEELYRILIKTEVEMTWPTLSAQKRLREAWGWAELTPTDPVILTGNLSTEM